MTGRALSLLLHFSLLLAAIAAMADPVPNLPMYSRTVTLAAGEAFGMSDVASSGSCNNTATQYAIVVKNGNADGTGKLAPSRAGVNGEDSCLAQLTAGQNCSADVLFPNGNGTIDMDLHAPAGSPAVAVVELWRKPGTLVYQNLFTNPVSSTLKHSTATFTTTNASLPAKMLITRVGGFTANDTTSITLNGTVIATKDDFQFSGQTILKSVTLLASNALVVDALAASSKQDITIKVVQTGADTAPPTLTIPAPPAKLATASYTFSGTVKDTSGVTSLKLNGNSVSFSGSSGTFNAPVTLTWGAPNTFAFVAYDCGGIGTQTIYTIWYDRDAPAVAVTTPAASAFLKTQAIVVTGTVTDDTPGTIAVTVNGIAATVTNNSWTANVSLPAGDGAKSLTVIATDSFQHSSTTTVPLTLDTTPPVITGAIDPTPESGGWNASGAAIGFDCTDALSGIATCTAPTQLTTTGIQNITGTATDKAGNTASATIVAKIDATEPQLSIATHPAVVKDTPYAITGSVSDAHSGILSATCGGVAATISGGTFTCSAPIASGANLIQITAVDRAGNQTSDVTQIRLDQRAPVVTILEPADGTVVNGTTVTVKGTLSDDDSIAAVRINGAAATITDNTFSKDVALSAGDNTIAIEVTDLAGNITTRSVGVNRFVVPTVTITSPADLAVLRDTTVTISGTVSDPNATVTVNDVNAAVSGGNFTAAGVPLAQGRTVITANAVATNGATATTSINLYRDSIPPRLEVYAPADNASVYATPISITGMVDDIVVGTINSQQMHVTVNGANAEVANRAFLMRNVALSPGANTFTITAIDAGGNTTVVTHHVTYVPAPPQPRLEIVSGNGQSGAIATQLAAPLVVRALSPADTPLANAMLTFEMIDNDGTVSDGTNSGRSVTVPTGANGQAQVRWTLGNRAGAGNHRVQIRSTGFAAAIEATATALTGSPTLIVVDSGNNQFGIAGDALPRPLVAIVVDAGNNRLANVPVTFTVTDGGGNFDGQTSATITTDSDGRAVVRPTLGPNPGEDNNAFTASVNGVTAVSRFVASGRAAGPTAVTRITGVILDNTAMPLEGVSVRIDGTTLHTQTDPQGQFSISGAPVGYVKLFIDGSTTVRQGTWPTLEYALYTLPGVDNSVGAPIFLVQLDTARGVFVDDTTGGTLKLAELPGFALEVKPGSATFPGGGRTGTVSATLVHADRIPMAPGFGQQPNFIVTIQPPGVHFDPPARMTLPNTDGLAPGSSTEMYSFDHDLGQFVTIGSATVSADGSVITSDPGVGIIKGGWHAGGDPVPPGGGSDCGECKEAVGDGCVIQIAMADQPCRPDALPCTYDFCRTGGPVHVTGTVSVTLESPRDNFNIPGVPYWPQVIAHAHVNGVSPDQTPTARFRWTGSVKYLAPNGTRHIDITLPPTVGDANYTVNFGATRGGELTVRATLLKDGASCAYGEAKHVINGVNPPFSLLSQQFQGDDTLTKMICHESSGMQFRPSPGPPLIHLETDHVRMGVGVMQVTDAPTDADFWDWVMNLNHGWRMYREKVEHMDGYEADKVKEGAPALTATQRLQNYVTYYNGGFYWYYRDHQWVSAPRLTPWPDCGTGSVETATCKYYWTRIQASTDCH